MYLFVVVLNKVELLEKVLESLAGAGIPGATILDSTGMGRALAQLNGDKAFAGIRSIFQYSRPHNKTIFSVIGTPEKKEAAVKAVTAVLGDMAEPGVGIIFTLSLCDVIGLNHN